MAESFKDQMRRLTQMSKDSGYTWDLSVNDQSAIAAVLDCHAKMLDLLKDALWEIETDLDQSGDDEVASNPLLRHKRQFAQRARRKIEAWGV